MQSHENTISRERAWGLLLLCILFEWVSHSVFSGLILKNFMGKFSDLRLCFLEDFFADPSAVIDLAPAAINPCKAGTDETTLLHPMEQRINRPRPQSISVTTQLLNHAKPKDPILTRMMQHMNTD